MNRRSFVHASALGTLAGFVGFVQLKAEAAPDVGLAPIFASRAWLNGRLTPVHASGRVVIVDIFTFECTNCTRVTPNLEALYRAYPRERLEIVGVHTPEVPSYQGRAAYVAREARRAALPWPIAIDTDYRIWHAYDVDAWPTQLVFDRRGKLVARIVGDSLDSVLDAAVRNAIAT